MKLTRKALIMFLPRAFLSHRVFSHAVFLYVICVLCGRLKVCVVTLLSAASFVIVSSGGSHVVWLSIFGQLIISMLLCLLCFSVAGQSVWNSSPDSLKDPDVGMDSFGRTLKTVSVHKLLILASRQQL